MPWIVSGPEGPILPGERELRSAYCGALRGAELARLDRADGRHVIWRAAEA